MKRIYSFDAIVTNVVDGDTLDLNVDLGFNIYTNIRVRLAGIDTAEMNSSNAENRDRGKQAKALLVDMINGKKVFVHSHKRDKFGRYLVDLYLDDKNINNILLENGLAVLYFGGKKT